MQDHNYKIFLASSSELIEDRKAFEIFINRQNNILQKKNVFLQLVLWEDLGDEVSLTHKQDDYNEALKTCDIFIVLYWTKMGKYTNMEFDMALAQFRSTKKQPKIFVYEKTAPAPGTVTEADKQSFAAFQQKLNDTGHFPTQYGNYHHFENQFKKGLEGLFDSGFLRYGEMAECLFTDGNSVPVNFIGRDEELKTIREKLDAGGRLMLINAEGGIGKTSLAAKYWDESLYKYKYNAWLFCENGIVTELKKLAPRLNVDLNGLNEEQQIDALKRALLSISKDFLLVLDNANNPEDIAVFKQTFRGFHWHVLITSRCRGILEKEQELPITHLPPPLAKDLFVTNYREDTPEFDVLLDRLLEAINYHTLLVEIFSKNMKHLRAFGETLADFLKQLETNGLFLEKRSFKIITDYTGNVHKEAGNTDAIVSILYDFSKLQETERYYMVNLALIPAVNYELIFLIDLFMPEDKFGFGAVLRNLAEKGWLSNEENGYRMSPVVQKLVLNKNNSTLQKDAEKLVGNLNEKLANDRVYLTHLNYSEVAPFAQLSPTITKHLKNQFFNALGLLNCNTHIYYLATGDLLEAQLAAENYRMISAALENKEGLALSYQHLGRSYTELGDLSKALHFFEEFNGLSKQFYEDHPGDIKFKSNLAISFQFLGSTYSDLGDLENALHFYEEFNELEKQLYKDHANDVNFKDGLAISCDHLGDTYINLGDLEKAHDFYKEYSEVQKELNDAHPGNVKFKHGLAISYMKLGITNTSLGDLEMALEFYKEFNELERQLHEDHPSITDFKNGLAGAHLKLGEAYTTLGDLKKALDCFEKSNELAKQLYEAHTDDVGLKNALAVSYYKLGEICEQNKEIETAKQYYYQTEDLLEQLVSSAPQAVEYKQNLDEVKQKLSEI